MTSRRCSRPQRKNFEAFTSANQLAFEGVKAVAQRQAELAREAVEQFQSLAKELSAPASVEEKLVKQAEVAKSAFEQSLATIRELNDTPDEVEHPGDQRRFEARRRQLRRSEERLRQDCEEVIRLLPAHVPSRARWKAAPPGNRAGGLIFSERML